MLRFAVCDTEPSMMKKILNSLKQLMHQLGVEAEIKGYGSGYQLKNDIRNQKTFDAVFMETDLNGVDGIRLGVQLRELEWNNFLIYISERESRVFQSFLASPFRFVRKSHFYQEIVPVVKDILRELQKDHGRLITLKSGNQIFRMHPYDIMYAESQRKKQCIYTGRSEIEINDTFKELTEFLKPFGFIRIHRSYAVNYRHIRSFNGICVELDNQIQLPVGRQRIPEVKEELQNLCLACG